MPVTAPRAERGRGGDQSETGVPHCKRDGMSAEMRAAESVRKTAAVTSETMRSSRALLEMSVMPGMAETGVVNGTEEMSGKSASTAGRPKTLGIPVQEKRETAPDENPWNVEREIGTEKKRGKGRENEMKPIEKRK